MYQLLRHPGQKITLAIKNNFVIPALCLIVLSSCSDDNDGPGDNERVQYTSTEISFETEDNITISAILDKPTEIASEAPAVILIHANGKDKGEWRSLNFYGMLQEKGYILMAYDIRFHGDSDRDQDLQGDLLTNPDRAPRDLYAAIDRLKQESFVDTDRIAAIGSKLGAELACIAVGTQDLGIKTAISLSPIEVSVNTLAANTVDFQLSSVFYLASELEVNGFVAADAQRLFDRTDAPRKITIVPETNATGTELLLTDFVNEELISWIEINL